MTFIERVISYQNARSKGLISENEFANAILLILSESDGCINAVRNIVSLSTLENIKKKLMQIEAAGFNWKPLILGPGLKPDEVEDLNRKLARLLKQFQEIDFGE